MAFKFLRPLNADDIFISYTRLDASTYAAGLADELTQLGFSCFIDRLGTDPDQDLPDTLRRKIRSCSMLVVVGTERAAGREIIEQEIREFLASGRTSIVPVNFSNAVYTARWYSLVEGIAPEPERSPTALDDGNPSASVISRIKKQFNYRRRDERLRLITRRAITVLVLLVIAIAVAAGIALQQLARAAAATARANAETLRAAEATREAQAAQNAMRVAKNEADSARVEANKQRDDAAKQKRIADKAIQTSSEQTRLASEAALNAQEATMRANAEQARAQQQGSIADSRLLANRSLTMLRERPEELPRSISIAIEALKKAPTAEADNALRRSLALLPRLQSRMRYVDYADSAALSPDGRHFATLTAGRTLRVYEVGSPKPLQEVPCHGQMLALSNDAAYAVVGDRNEVVIFDLKNGRDHSFKIRSENSYLEQMALSPGGKYLAVVSGYGEVRIASLFETVNGRLVKSFTNDLGFHVMHMAFGPTGNLALSGFEDMRSDLIPSRFAGRMLIWGLANKLENAETGRELTDEDFAHPFDPRIEGDHSAITPGKDVTTVATETAIWKFAVSNQYECIARIPVTYTISEGNVFRHFRRLALDREGTRLTVITKTRYRSDSDRDPSVPPPTDQNGPNATSPVAWQLETWDTTGQVDAANVSDLSFFQGLAFAPDGRLAGLANNEGSPALVARPIEGAEEKSDASESSAGQQTVLVSQGLDFVVTDDLHSPTAYVRGVWRPKKIRVSYGDDLKTLSLTAAVTAGGRFLALVGPDAKADDKATTVIVYRLKGEAYEKWKKLRAKDETRRVKLSPDGRLLALINDDKTVQLWDLVDDRDVGHLGLRKLKGVESLAFSPDGRLLVATDKSDESESLFVHVWRLADGVELAALSHDDSISEPVFSPDGRQLLLGSQDGVTRMLDLLSGRERRVLEGVEVSTVGFSPDGRYLGVVTFNSELLVYKTDDLENEIVRLELNSNPASVVGFSDDNRYVATAANYYLGLYSKPLRVWELSSETLIEEAMKRLALLPQPATRPQAIN